MVHVLDGDRVVDPRGGVWGVASRVNLLKEGAPAPEGPRVVCWTGWMGDGAAEDAERDFRLWGPGPWADLRAALRAAMQVYESAGTRLVLRPHARHVVSDTQRWVKLREECPWVGLLVDPVSLFSQDMLGRAEEHLDRLAAALGGSAEGFLVSDAAPGEDGLLRRVAWGEGAMPRDVLLRAALSCGGAAITLRGDDGAASALGRVEA